MRNLLFIVAVLLSACQSPSEYKDQPEMTKNPAVYFEIPVNDIERATTFYNAVFGFDFTYESIHDNQMAFLPLVDGQPGITGALVKGDIYKPTKEGVLIYFGTNDIQNTVALAVKNGGKVLFPKTAAGNYGYAAEIEDSEGNRIGLSEAPVAP